MGHHCNTAAFANQPDRILEPDPDFLNVSGLSLNQVLLENFFYIGGIPMVNHDPGHMGPSHGTAARCPDHFFDRDIYAVLFQVFNDAVRTTFAVLGKLPQGFDKTTVAVIDIDPQQVK